MPKQEVGSTKWLGNKMKAKGLQKLRWYCQMCQKQCRDENGFKCHRMSDGHQRQMQVFVQDPNKFMDEFSQEFESGFMKLMSHTYRSQRILANTVYCDFISNRHHTHMNSTIWVTLSNFVQYLGRTNQCTIDKTPKGWYIQYVDNTPEARMREEARKNMERAELAEEEVSAKRLRDQVENAKADGGFRESEFTEMQREEGDAPISFGMSASSSSAAAAPSAPPARKKGVAELFGDDESEEKPSKDGQKRKQAPKISAVEAVRLEHEASKRGDGAKRQRVDARRPPSPGSTSPSPEGGQPWLAAGLIVKVMHEDLANGKYYRKKGQIEKVHDQFTADVRMSDSKDLVRLDQELLETVIPNVGKAVRLVKGSHKGAHAVMRHVDIEAFSVSVELEDGTRMEGLGYDEVCKVAE